MQPVAAHPAPGPLQPTEKPGPYSPEPDPVPQPPKKEYQPFPLPEDLTPGVFFPEMLSRKPVETCTHGFHGAFMA